MTSDSRSDVSDVTLQSYEGGALLLSLMEPDLHISLTPKLLLHCNNVELFSLLPLVLAAVQNVGETPGQRSTFAALVHALRARATSSRSVKLRFLLLARNPVLAEYWNLRVIHRSQAYPAAWATLLSLLHGENEGQNLLSEQGVHSSTSMRAIAEAVAGEQSDDAVLVHSGISSNLNGGTAVSAVAESWYRDSHSLYRYAVEELFAPGKGVPMRDHTRHLRVVHDSFYASELVDAIMERANFVDRTDAVEIGQRLQNAKLITRVSGTRATFCDKDKLYQSRITLHRSDDQYVSIRTSTGEAITGWREFESSPGQEPVKSVEVRIPCDMTDLQSLEFWARTVYIPDPVPNYRFGYSSISHPMIPDERPSDLEGGESDNENDASSVGDSGTTQHDAVQQNRIMSAMSSIISHASFTPPMSGNDLMAVSGLSGHTLSRSVISNVVVRKVFSSIARPMIIELRRPLENADIDDDSMHTVEKPNLLVKEGDNLGQDMCVEVMFRCFNSIWQRSPEHFPDASEAPVAVTYEVFPTAAKQGFIEVLPNLTSLHEFDWYSWTKRFGTDSHTVMRMVTTAVGSYVGAAVLGAADRHPENVQIQNEGTMLHIDFGFLLGSKPPIDGPRFAIYPEMQNALENVNAWDLFVDMCERAFLALRRRAPAITRVATMLFTKFGFDEVSIREFLNSSLDTHQSNERAAGGVVRHEVMNSSSMWKTKFKLYAHEKIDPVFYSALEKRFPPAVFAMKIVDAKQQHAAKKLEESGAHPSMDSKEEVLSL